MNTRYPAGMATKQFFFFIRKGFFFFTVLSKKSISRKHTADVQYQMKLFQQLGSSFLLQSCFRTKHNCHCTIGLWFNAATLNVYFIFLFLAEAVAMK